MAQRKTFLTLLTLALVMSHTNVHAQALTPKLTAAEETALRNSAAPPQDTILWSSKGLINIHFSQVQLSNWLK